MLPDGYLARQLKNSCPDLYEGLQTAWKIATNDWLSALNTKSGSYNSYPHLRNIEGYLDQICEAMEQYHGIEYFLKPFEIYLLLLSVLLHDIGRIQNGNEHAANSKNIIKRMYAHLGIPNAEIADSLGRICYYHDPESDDNRNMARQELYTTVIAPYGEIRELLIAALLCLADTMDNTFQRVIPDYLPEDGPVAAIRRCVKGVYFDPMKKLLRTLFSTRDIEKNSTKPIPYVIILNQDQQDKGYEPWDDLKPQFKKAFNRNPDYAKEFRSELDYDFDRNIQKAVKPFFQCNGKEKYDALWAKIGFLKLAVLPVKNKREFRKKNGNYYPFNNYDAINILLLGLLFKEIDSRIGKGGKTLYDIRRDLAKFGIYISAWLLDINETLYNRDARESFEPIFHHHYLCEVAEGMWRLSTQVFGMSRFTYEELAGMIGDIDVFRVKVAVKRIAVIARNWNNRHKEFTLNPIWDGIDTWSWSVDSQESKCDFMHVEKLTGIIESTGLPSDE